MEVPDLLIMFVRYPRIGAVKTRMTQHEHSTHPLSPHETLELYKAFLADWIPRLKTGAGFDLRIMLGGAQREEMESFRRRYSLHPSQLKQMPATPSDLGALMEHCFEQGFHEGYTGIALIGSDAPQIPMLRIRRVFEYLNKTPIVIGPDNGGGMYLIACSRPLGIMKKGITWGQGLDLQAILHRCQRQTIAYQLLPVEIDLDTSDDLIDWYDMRHSINAEASTFKEACPQTLSFVEQWMSALSHRGRE